MPALSTRVVITGGSRGIGEALARSYAAPGTSLVLIGRDTTRLAGAASACRGLGAEVEEVACDVRDRDGLRERLLALDAAAPIEIVIANAGIALPTSASPGDLAVYGELEANLLGSLNTILPLAPAMAARGRGQIALMSSLAAFAPLPGSPGYSASKAALLAYGLALRERMRGSGVRVNVICPGYIDTEMGSRYRGWRPLHMSAEEAAARIRAGLGRDKAVIAFPRRLAVLARAAQFVPDRVRALGLRRFRSSITSEKG